MRTNPVSVPRYLDGFKVGTLKVGSKLVNRRFTRRFHVRLAEIEQRIRRGISSKNRLPMNWLRCHHNRLGRGSRNSLSLFLHHSGCNIRRVKVVIDTESKVVVGQLEARVFVAECSVFTSQAPVRRKLVFDTQPHMCAITAKCAGGTVRIDACVTQFGVRQPITGRQAKLEVQTIFTASVSVRCRIMIRRIVVIEKTIHTQQQAVYIPVITSFCAIGSRALGIETRYV